MESGKMFMALMLHIWCRRHAFSILQKSQSMKALHQGCLFVSSELSRFLHYLSVLKLFVGPRNWRGNLCGHSTLRFHVMCTSVLYFS